MWLMSKYRTPFGSVMTQRKMPLMAVGSDGVGRGLVQVDRELGKMNDMLYRQCRNYTVRFSAWPVTSSATTYRLFTLPDTWFTHGAIKHAYANWLKSLRDNSPVGAKFAKWYDFRIEPSIAGNNSVLESCLAEMSDGGTNQVTWSVTYADEYAYSKTRNAAGSEMGLYIGAGADVGFNIEAEFQKSLTSRQPDSLVVTHEGSYTDLHDASDHLIAQHMAEGGDRAPYDYDRETIGDGVIPWVLQDQITVDLDAGYTNETSRFFNAPLGIVMVVKDRNLSEEDFSTSQPELLMEVAAGKYKGVKAPAIVNFNPRKLEKTIGRA